MSGPNTLDNLAQYLRVSGLPGMAVTLNTCAEAWRAERAEHEKARRTIGAIHDNAREDAVAAEKRAVDLATPLYSVTERSLEHRAVKVKDRLDSMQSNMNELYRPFNTYKPLPVDLPLIEKAERVIAAVAAALKDVP